MTEIEKKAELILNSLNRSVWEALDKKKTLRSVCCRLARYKSSAPV